MQNIEVVEPLEAQSHLDKRTPYGLLVEICVVFLVAYDFLVKVAVVQKFHDYAEWGGTYQRELASMKECL